MEKMQDVAIVISSEELEGLLRLGDNVTLEKFLPFYADQIVVAGNLGATSGWVMLWLMQAWKRNRFPKAFCLTDKQLSELTGIKSRTTLLKTRKKLQKAGLIRCTPSNTHEGTTYYIVTSMLTDGEGEES